MKLREKDVIKIKENFFNWGKHSQGCRDIEIKQKDDEEIKINISKNQILIQ